MGDHDTVPEASAAVARTDPRKRPGFDAFVLLLALGCLGLLANVANLVFVYDDPGALVGVGIQAVLVTGGVLAGLYAASRVGFVSRLVDYVTTGTRVRESIRADLKPALGIGAVVGPMVFALEWLTPLGAEWTVETLLLSAPQRLLWGGIAEELIMRWGLMSVLVLGAWWVTGSKTRRPSPRLIWTVIVVVAVAFGVLHLPSVAADTAQTIVLVVGGNALAAIGFGWLFWRYSLEAAMIAHGFAHVVYIGIWLGILVG